jgi:hypothetical protein
VDLVDLVEQAGGVGGEEVGQPGGEPGANGHGAAPHPGFVVEGEQRPGRAQLVGARHDRSPGLEGPLGLVAVVLAGPGQDHDVVAGKVDFGGADGRGDGAERGAHRGDEGDPGVGDGEGGDPRGGGQLPGGPAADGARPEDGDPHRRSGPDSSRQPPDCGGVPPVPRRRSTAATRPMIPTAMDARRRNWITPQP